VSEWRLRNIDLAKNVFAVHGVNELGKPGLVRPAVPRAKLQSGSAARRLPAAES